MIKKWFSVLAVTAVLGVISPTWGGSIVASLGTQDTTNNNPAIHVNPILFTAPTGAAPFDGTYDGSSDISGPDFSATWAFSYVMPPLSSVIGATFYLQIYDADVCTTPARNPVASFTIDGTDLTSALNTAFLADPCGTTNANKTGNINKELLTLPGLLFTPLATSPATVSLTLADVGRGVLGNTSYNGAELIYSELDLTTAANPTTPEPGTWVLMLSAVAAAGGRRLLARRG